MSGPAAPTSLEPLVRQLQVITAALVAGCVFFTMIAVVILGGWPDAWADGVLTYASVGVAIVALFTRLVIPLLLETQTRRQIFAAARQNDRAQSAQDASAAEPALADVQRTGQLLKLFQARIIVGHAILEGAAFFLLVVAIVDQASLPLLLAIVLVAGLAFGLPTRGRVDSWLVEQRRRLNEEQFLAG